MTVEAADPPPMDDELASGPPRCPYLAAAEGAWVAQTATPTIGAELSTHLPLLPCPSSAACV